MNFGSTRLDGINVFLNFLSGFLPLVACSSWPCIQILGVYVYALFFEKAVKVKQ